MLNPFRAVQGELWKKRDIQEWNEKSYLAFLQCVDRFTVIGKKGELTIAINAEGLMKLEQDAFSGEQPFLHEMVIRIGQLTTDPKATPHKFYTKFTAILRQVGSYIRGNPTVVTDRMRTLIEGNPRMSWMLSHYTLKTSKIGVPLVVEARRDNVDSRSLVMPSPKNPDVRIMEAKVSLSDALQVMTSSLTKKELRKMTAGDKIKHSVGILKVLQQASSYKPNVGILNQLVIQKADRDDLESALLDFNRNKE